MRRCSRSVADPSNAIVVAAAATMVNEGPMPLDRPDLVERVSALTRFLPL